MGASLLALAVGQLAAMLAGRPPSRASSAPTRVLGWLQDLCLPPIPVWERACSRWRWVSWRGCWMDCRLREQARSHKGSRVDTRFVSTTHSGVGASLLAMAGGQVAAMLAGRPSSRASSAPTGVLGWLQDLCLPPIPVWERACSRWRWVSWRGCWMDCRLREQARSHKGSRVVTRFVSTTHSSVGASLLAMAMGQLAGMLDGLPSSRASPLPQGFSGGYKICVHHPFRCGSELARDGGGSGCGDVGRATVIASKLGSHKGSRVVTRFVSTTHSSVGASLLAMAVGQVALMPKGPASSRASSLPQGIGCWR